MAFRTRNPLHFTWINFYDIEDNYFQNPKVIIDCVNALNKTEIFCGASQTNFNLLINDFFKSGATYPYENEDLNDIYNLLNYSKILFSYIFSKMIIISETVYIDDENEYVFVDENSDEENIIPFTFNEDWNKLQGGINNPLFQDLEYFQNVWEIIYANLDRLNTMYCDVEGEGEINFISAMPVTGSSLTRKWADINNLENDYDNSTFEITNWESQTVSNEGAKVGYIYIPSQLGINYSDRYLQFYKNNSPFNPNDINSSWYFRNTHTSNHAQIIKLYNPSNPVTNQKFIFKIYAIWNTGYDIDENKLIYPQSNLEIEITIAGNDYNYSIPFQDLIDNRVDELTLIEEEITISSLYNDDATLIHMELHYVKDDIYNVHPHQTESLQNYDAYFCTPIPLNLEIICNLIPINEE